MTIPSVWESSILDWSGRDLNGGTVTCTQVLTLTRADSRSAADRAYWSLDGKVCKNGLISPAALPVVQTLLAFLPSWTQASKPNCLELLGQICTAEESTDGAKSVKLCRLELREAAWYFLNGLQFDSVRHTPLYVDLLWPLADSFPEMRLKIYKYLDLARGREVEEWVRHLITNIIKDMDVEQDAG